MAIVYFDVPNTPHTLFFQQQKVKWHRQCKERMETIVHL